MDESLIHQLESAIRSGEGASLIVVLCVARLRSLAHHMLQQNARLRRDVDTDDLLQNAAIRMQRALADVVVESPRHALALAVLQLRRELVDVVRAHQRRARLEASDTGVDPDSGEHRREEDLHTAWTEFHATVESLPQPQREAVHVLWYLGLAQGDGAQILGISERTLRRHWTAARSTLQQRLDAGDFAGDS